MNHYEIFILEKVRSFLENRLKQESARIYAHIEMMKTGNFDGLEIKTLKSPLQELKYKHYRILFFIYGSNIYIISSFIKKSQKTPKNELNKAQQIIKIIMKSYE